MPAVNEWTKKLNDLQQVLNNGRGGQPTASQQDTTLQPDRISPDQVEADRVYDYNPPAPQLHQQEEIYEYHPARKSSIKEFAEETGLWLIGMGVIQAVAVKFPAVPIVGAALKILIFPTNLLVVGVALLVYGVHAYRRRSFDSMATALQAAIGFIFSVFAIAFLL